MRQSRTSTFRESQAVLHAEAILRGTSVHSSTIPFDLEEKLGSDLGIAPIVRNMLCAEKLDQGARTELGIMDDDLLTE